MDDSNERAQRIGAQLKTFFDKKGLTQQEIADILHIHQTNVSAMLLGKRNFGRNSALKWSEAFGLRVNWLITGDGPMFESETAVTQTNVNGDNVIAQTINNIADNNTTSTPFEKDDLIPIVPRDIAKMPNTCIWEFMNTASTSEYDSAPKIHLFPRYDFYFQCVTDAMQPEICQGDLLGIRRHDPDAPLINGDTYVFDTKSSGMLIRMLMETTDGTGYLALAHNERYKQILFPRSEILNIFTIVGLVRVK